MKTPLLSILTFALGLSSLGCGVSSGPSLIPVSTGGGTGDVNAGGGTGTDQFIKLVNGQAADGVLGQVDFATSDYAATQDSLGGLWYSGIMPLPSGGLLAFDGDFNRIVGWDTIPTNPFPNPAQFLIGQTNWTNASSGVAGKFNQVAAGDYDPTSQKWVAAEKGNLRILIYNGFPSSQSAGAPFITSAPVHVVGAPDMSTVRSSFVCDSTHFKPYDVAINGGRMLVADNDGNRVLLYNSIPNVDDAPANLALGQVDLTTCDPGTTNGMEAPTGVWTDGTRIAVADANNNRVLIWTSWPTNQTQAQNPNLVLGQPDFTQALDNNTPGDPGTVSAKSLHGPWALASNGSQFFVVDNQNKRVLVWNSFPTQNQQAADVVIGQPDMTSGSFAGPLGPANLSDPYGVKFSGKTLLINDGGVGRILVYRSR